jgi:PAS domain-containing protein
MRKARWAYNPGMATIDARSLQMTAALDARLVVDAIPGLAWSSHPDGSVEFFNARWYDYTGLSPEESHGWGWKAAIHADDLARLVDRWGARDAEGGRGCEVRLRRSDGDFQWFLLRHEPVCDPGAQWCGGMEPG